MTISGCGTARTRPRTGWPALRLTRRRSAGTSAHGWRPAAGWSWPRGSSLYGPHRDELIFLVNGWNLRAYGSRGQQRTGALALKLAELQAMSEATGEKPILLLDDVMSELDAQRRAALLDALADVRQGIVTTTDWAYFSADFQQNAQRLQIEAGAAILLSEPARIDASNGMAG